MTETVAVWIPVAALVISLASGAAAWVAVAYSRGQRDATERQADAAEAQVEYMRRQVELMEEEGGSGGSVGGGAPGRTRVPPWAVSHSRGDTYSLINGSSEPVYDVVLDPPNKSIHRGPYTWGRIDPHATVNFLVAFSMGTPGREVTVRWKWEPDGREEEWTTVMPSKD